MTRDRRINAYSEVFPRKIDVCQAATRFSVSLLGSASLQAAVGTASTSESCRALGVQECEVDLAEGSASLISTEFVPSFRRSRCCTQRSTSLCTTQSCCVERAAWLRL